MSISAKLKHLLVPDQRRKLARYWIFICLAYDVLRATLVSILFRRNGISGWVYFAIELIFSVAFSFSSFRLITAIIDKRHRHIFLYSVLTFASFFAPDLYIVIVGHHIKKRTFFILGIYLLTTTIFTLLTIAKDIKHKREITALKHRA